MVFWQPQGTEKPAKSNQNLRSVARKQGFAKIRNWAPGIYFWLSFWCLWPHFSSFVVVFAFFFSALFFDTLKYAQRPIKEQTDHAEVASGPPRRMLQHGVKSSKKSNGARKRLGLHLCRHGGGYIDMIR